MREFALQKKAEKRENDGFEGRNRGSSHIQKYPSQNRVEQLKINNFTNGSLSLYYQTNPCWLNLVSPIILPPHLPHHSCHKVVISGSFSTNQSTQKGASLNKVLDFSTAREGLVRDTTGDFMLSVPGGLLIFSCSVPVGTSQLLWECRLALRGLFAGVNCENSTSCGFQLPFLCAS